MNNDGYPTYKDPHQNPQANYLNWRSKQLSLLPLPYGAGAQLKGVGGTNFTGKQYRLSACNLGAARSILVYQIRYLNSPLCPKTSGNIENALRDLNSNCSNDSDDEIKDMNLQKGDKDTYS